MALGLWDDVEFHVSPSRLVQNSFPSSPKLLRGLRTLIRVCSFTVRPSRPSIQAPGIVRRHTCSRLNRPVGSNSRPSNTMSPRNEERHKLT